MQTTIQKQLDLLITLANRLCLTPRIGKTRQFIPGKKWSIIWLDGGGNNISNIHKSSLAINRFICHLTTGLVHEIAHYLAASPDERKRKNYGIPKSQNANQRKIYDCNETKVFCIEYHIRKAIGLKHPKDFLQLSGRINDMKQYRKKTKCWWKKVGMKIVNDFLKGT